MPSKITITDLGPLNHCEMSLNNFTVLTGTQASGKSTIAKCVYFCKTVKDDIFQVIIKKAAYFDEYKLYKRVRHVLRGKFLQMFGPSTAMKSTMHLHYEYTPRIWIDIAISQRNDTAYTTPNYANFLYVKLSNVIF